MQKLVSLFLSIAIFGPVSMQAAPVAKPRLDFTLKVLPLLKAKCFACHGDDPQKIKGDLNLLSREAMLKGGENSQKVLVPGKAEESDLYISVTWENDDLEMPPKENDRLTAEQVAVLKAWIDAGAPWPGEEEQKQHLAWERSQVVTAEGVILGTSGGLADAWTFRRYRPEDMWAFQPVKNVASTLAESGSEDAAKAAATLDAFHAAKLTAAGQKRAPEADARTLIRRATFDLTGLPPTPEEVNAFETAFKADFNAAWGALIDRLLASPHYGERWAQHWFDVVRYADTGGMANDYERSNMWRYRDWVIRAFNDDMPYDQFVSEQLAGDELADQAALKRVKGDEQQLAQIRKTGDYSEEEARKIIATGFLRLGPWDNAMVTDEEARQIYLDDLVNAVGQTFLATTMRCFKCHDHKFDPLPTRDYYRMYAALAGTQMAERPLRFMSEENREGFAENKAHVQRMFDFARGAKDKLAAQREAAAKAWYAEHKLPYKNNEARKDDADEMKPPRNIGLDYVAEGQLKVREQDDWIWERNLERFEPMVQSVFSGAPGKKAWNAARKLRMPEVVDVSWKPENFIYSGGALTAPGEKVQPGVLSVLKHGPELLPENVTERRLGLANWIAHPGNALTTRSIVNRIWQHHFGKPLAGNPNNFGAKGAKPTHPELLDFLAHDLVKHGWKLKRLHKLIMMSAAYRMSTQHPQSEALREKDPANDLLAFFPTRRLSAEEMRDAMLHITGELNPALGGLPVFPEINMEVALQPRMIQFSLAPSYQPSPTPQERNRRSIYAYRVRGQADPFMEVFNKPGPNDACELRDSAAVSPQAFTLLNSDMMTDRSIAFALRVEKEAKTAEAQIERIYQLAFGRSPTAAESNRLVRYLNEMQTYHAGTKPGAVTYPTKVTRSLVEEFSGKTFEYEEILPTFENYTPDKKAADVSSETHALADVCLLLLNSHEFIFLN